MTVPASASSSTFALLHRGGLTEASMLLEVGCGALRFARLAIPFLLPGHYACIEPQPKLVDAGFRFELGYDILLRKRPRFAHNAVFQPPPDSSDPIERGATVSNSKYDIMLAQSIFTHTAADMLELAIKRLIPHLADTGARHR